VDGRMRGGDADCIDRMHAAERCSRTGKAAAAGGGSAGGAKAAVRWEKPKRRDLLDWISGRQDASQAASRQD
jgi:hypothetical protein